MSANEQTLTSWECLGGHIGTTAHKRSVPLFLAGAHEDSVIGEVLEALDDQHVVRGLIIGLDAQKGHTPGHLEGVHAIPLDELPVDRKGRRRNIGDGQICRH